jgi:hypothetical protein
MEDETKELFQALGLIKEQVILLTVAGIGGGFFRAILAPEKKIMQRVVQGVAGALSAIFLGGLMATMTNSVIEGGHWSYLAWGFLMGTSGEVAVKMAQEKMMGASSGRRNSK